MPKLIFLKQKKNMLLVQNRKIIILKKKRNTIKILISTRFKQQNSKEIKLKHNVCKQSLTKNFVIFKKNSSKSQKNNNSQNLTGFKHRKNVQRIMAQRIIVLMPKLRKPMNYMIHRLLLQILMVTQKKHKNFKLRENNN